MFAGMETRRQRHSQVPGQGKQSDGGCGDFLFKSKHRVGASEAIHTRLGWDSVDPDSVDSFHLLPTLNSCALVLFLSLEVKSALSPSFKLDHTFLFKLDRLPLILLLDTAGSIN